jgi:hypothetical protein
MDDNRQLRIFYLIFFSMVLLILESERTMTKLRGLLAAKRGNFT